MHMIRLTAKQHGEYSENFLGVSDRCDVAEPDTRYDGEGEIQRSNVARPDIRSAGRVISQVRHPGLPRELVQPADGCVEKWALEVSNGVEDASEPM